MNARRWADLGSPDPADLYGDAPYPSGEDRFGIYTIRDGELRRLAATSQDGIGLTITTLVGEGEFRDEQDRQTPLGIRDRQTREWIIHPFVARTTE